MKLSHFSQENGYSIGHFAQSYITNLYDKQKKKKNCQPIGGHVPPPPVVTPLFSLVKYLFTIHFKTVRILVYHVCVFRCIRYSYLEHLGTVYMGLPSLGLNFHGQIHCLQSLSSFIWKSMQPYQNTHDLCNSFGQALLKYQNG